MFVHVRMYEYIFVINPSVAIICCLFALISVLLSMEFFRNNAQYKLGQMNSQSLEIERSLLKLQQIILSQALRTHSDFLHKH